MTAPCAVLGVWMAYYHDWSSFRIFSTELEALRWAVDRGPCSVVWLEWSEDPQNAAAVAEQIRNAP